MITVNGRPVFLDLFKVKLPIAGIMSIVHRASGAVMVLGIPFLLYLLERSLAGPEGFAEVAALLDGLTAKLMLFLGLWALIHHLLAGIRYLLIDIDIGVEKPGFRSTAWAVLLAAPVLALFFTGVL